MTCRTFALPLDGEQALTRYPPLLQALDLNSACARLFSCTGNIIQLFALCTVDS